MSKKIATALAAAAVCLFGQMASAIAAPTATLAMPSPRTSNLYQLLKAAELDNSAYFGQQHASYQGYTAQCGTDNIFSSFETDIYNSLAASLVPVTPDHPAVFGWNYQVYLYSAPTAQALYRSRMIQSDAAGGITTIHWTLHNFVICDPSQGDFCEDNYNQAGVDPVAMIKNNTPYSDPVTGQTKYARDEFDKYIDGFATFASQLKAADQRRIPIIVRLFHEMNNPEPTLKSHWWTGRSPEDYKYMYRRAVDRIRTKTNNVLFAFAPTGDDILKAFTGTPYQNYAKFWPEIDNPTLASQRYVDIVGADKYMGTGALGVTELAELIDEMYAFAKHPLRGATSRITALTETGPADGLGAGSNPNSGDFWIPIIYNQISSDPNRWGKMAYMMTWTNRNSCSYFSSYGSAPNRIRSDFREFFTKPETKFLSELPSF